MMIRNIKGGDLVTSGSDQLVSGKRAAGLSATYRLRMIKGEDFMNVNNGTPWFSDILGHADQAQAETLIRHQLLASPTVAGVASLSFDYNRYKREIAVSATLISAEGDTVPVAFTSEVF